MLINYSMFIIIPGSRTDSRIVTLIMVQLDAECALGQDYKHSHVAIVLQTE